MIDLLCMFIGNFSITGSADVTVVIPTDVHVF